MEPSQERPKKVNSGFIGKFFGGFRGKPLMTAVVAVAILAAVLAVTFAWYGRMRQAAGASTVASDDYWLFELGAVKNDAGTARKIAVDTTVLDIMSTLEGRDYGRDVLETSANDTGVLCALESDDANPLRPGSSGKLQFVIMPKKDDLTFYATLGMTGIKKIVDEDAETVSYSYIDVADAEDAKALGYLETHILFFADSAHTTRIDIEDELYIDDAEDAGDDYVVTIYWEWPRTYSDHAAYVDDTWRSTHTYLDEDEGDAGYNNADQVIGERVSHIIVEVDVTGSSVSDGAVRHEVAAVKLN